MDAHGALQHPQIREAASGEGAALTVVLPFLAGLYLRWVGLTSSVRWIGRDIRDRLEQSGTGFIYAFWHARQLFLPYLHRGDAIHPLISSSKDGELVARVAEHFGLICARGSSSRRGSEAALEMRRWLVKGDRVSITPDGPRGPAGRVSPGVVRLAQAAGVPIVPVAYGSKRKWVFNSWDRFQVPKPFSRICMVYGDPIYVKPDDALDQAAERVRLGLNQVTETADAAVG